MKRPPFATLYTPSGEALTGQPWPSYPRPRLKREKWLNLNGEWAFAVSAGKAVPAAFDRAIRVPFPPESLLSGVHEVFSEEMSLFYRRVFRLPAGFSDGRVLLHFGAVDQVANVYLNSVHLGERCGERACLLQALPGPENEKAAGALRVW